MTPRYREVASLTCLYMVARKVRVLWAVSSSQITGYSKKMRILIGIIRVATSLFLVDFSTKYTPPLMIFVHRKSLFFLGQIVIFPVQVCLIADQAIVSRSGWFISRIYAVWPHFNTTNSSGFLWLSLKSCSSSCTSKVSNVSGGTTIWTRGRLVLLVKGAPTTLSLAAC